MEMVDLSHRYEVAVVDECQLIGDRCVAAIPVWILDRLGEGCWRPYLFVDTAAYA